MLQEKYYVNIEKGWVLWFQRVKDRFVLPTFRSEYSDLLQGEDVCMYVCMYVFMYVDIVYVLYIIVFASEWNIRIIV